MIVRFQSCEVDTDRMEIRTGGELIPVEPQVFRLLIYLIENRDRVVSKDELGETIWRGRIVSDATVSSRISFVRRAIGDSGRNQHAVRTIARCGFRFVANIESGEEDLSEADVRSPQKVNQTIRYCSATDGVRLAYATTGQGRAVVKTMSWLNHLEFDWESPVFRDLFQGLSARHLLMRYDSRGIGLSDWNVDDFSFPALSGDLEASIDASGLESFALLGISQGAALAIDYAVRHPEKVTHLILWGGYSRGRNRRGLIEDQKQAEAFKTLMRSGWGKESSIFRKMFSTLYLPDATEEQIGWWTELQRIATTPENAVRLRETIDDIDISDRLPLVKAPTLILHSQREEVAPFPEARRMAAQIPNAKLIPLDSANHLVLHHEPAWQRAVDAILSFLDS